MNTKRIIWTNDVDTSEKAVEAYRKDCAEYDEDAAVLSDSALIERMYEENAEYLNDEMLNLDIPTDGRVIAIADLGLWNGRKRGYRILGRNVNEIFRSSCGDYVTFYSDNQNIRCDDSHHDGTNHYLFRELREDTDVDRFLNEIVYGSQPLTSSYIYRFTKSILPQVADVYGWPCASRKTRVTA